MPIPPYGRQLNMAAGVRDFARATPHAIAVVDGDRTFSFGAIEDRAKRLANALLNAGLEPGARIAILLGNRAEYVEIPAALGRIGMVTVPLNPRLTAAEMTYIIGHSHASALIADATYRSLAEPALAEHTMRLVLTMLDSETSLAPVAMAHDGKGDLDYERTLADSLDTDPSLVVNETEPFTIVYTSGTTGRPKGVLISHRSRVLTGLATGLDWGLGPGRTTIAVAPMYHGAGFILAYAAPMLGGTVWMLRSFDAEQLLAMIARSRASSIFMVPTHAQLIRALDPKVRERYDCTCLTNIYFNAAPLPYPLKEWVMRAFPGAGIHEMYGSTEASIVSNLRPSDALRKPGSVGTAWFQTEIRLVDQDGAVVGPGGVGELFSRSPYLMTGYLDDDDATRACTTADGFLTSGDIARMDEDGYLHIIDRKKDLIISGGINIYPREIEDVLLRHPSVQDVGAVGVPSDQWGESVAAFVVFHRDAEASPDELEQFCRQDLAGFKVPRIWHYVEALPRNAAGKVLKTELRLRAVRDLPG